MKTMLLMRTILFFGILSGLSSCARPTGDFCLIAKPITYSGYGDTEETIYQVRQHNAVYKELCE